MFWRSVKRLAEITLKIAFALVLFVAIGVAASSSQAQESSNQSPGPNVSGVQQCIVVYGAVRTPTRFEVRRPVRLAEALTIAGGLTDDADRTIEVIQTETQCFRSLSRLYSSHIPIVDESYIRISGKTETYEISDLLRGDGQANPVLRPGDVVIVNDLPSIFVIGNVKKPRQISWKEGLTLTQAIELAGGVLPNTLKYIHVYRAIGNRIGVEDLQYELRAIKKRRASDPVLQRYDIIDVARKDSHGDRLGSRWPKLSERIIE
jgi:protein involved in polysaccharide export with SLBB domain